MNRLEKIITILIWIIALIAVLSNMKLEQEKTELENEVCRLKVEVQYEISLFIWTERNI